MAKRKRATHEKPFSRPLQTAAAGPAITESTVADSPVNGSPVNGSPVNGTSLSIEEQNNDVADQFIGKWNRLISTTNWEKGQIICDWREALVSSGVAVTQYSDEAWAHLVGGVTSQHVGRLRRVSQRFGAAYQQYDGLHWSHFQACLDWEDAEMWLEGSIQNSWSVSQMRGKRWETVGTTPEEQQAEVEQVVAELATEAEAEAVVADREAAENRGSLAPSTAEVNSLGESQASNAGEAASAPPSAAVGSSTDVESADQVSKRTRLSVDVESLPDDLAEAFESFKLAIIAHRRENWRDTTPESVVECLESLKQLTTAEAG